MNRSDAGSTALNPESGELVRSKPADGAAGATGEGAPAVSRKNATMTAAAIAGTFAKVLPVQSRGVVQFVFEVPVEKAHEAVGILGGYPVPGETIWCAIARLTEQPRSAKASPELQDASANGPDVGRATGRVAAPQATTKEKRKWSDMRWVERFGILCEDRQFDEWVTHHAPSERWDGQHFEEADCSDEVWQSEFPASYVRWYCGVTSRKLIDGNPDAEARAAILLTEWDAHIGRTGRPG